MQTTNSSKLLGNILMRLESRRIKWAHDERIQLMFYHQADENNHMKILSWVERHTTSDFYLGGSHIGFANEKDTLIFKLGWKP